MTAPADDAQIDAYYGDDDVEDSEEIDLSFLEEDEDVTADKK